MHEQVIEVGAQIAQDVCDRTGVACQNRCPQARIGRRNAGGISKTLSRKPERLSGGVHKTRSKHRRHQLRYVRHESDGVVIAAEGYPGSYPKGMEIKGIDAVDALPDTKVFQAGTKREGSRTLSSGGRVLCVTALGKGLAEAQKRAYEAVAKIDMEKSQHRSDIGAKGLRRL